MKNIRFDILESIEISCFSESPVSLSFFLTSAWKRFFCFHFLVGCKLKRLGMTFTPTQNGKSISACLWAVDYITFKGETLEVTVFEMSYILGSIKFRSIHREILAWHFTSLVFSVWEYCKGWSTSFLILLSSPPNNKNLIIPMEM